MEDDGSKKLKIIFSIFLSFVHVLFGSWKPHYFGNPLEAFYGLFHAIFMSPPSLFVLSVHVLMGSLFAYPIAFTSSFKNLRSVNAREFPGKKLKAMFKFSLLFLVLSIGVRCIAEFAKMFFCGVSVWLTWSSLVEVIKDGKYNFPEKI